MILRIAAEPRIVTMVHHGGSRRPAELQGFVAARHADEPDCVFVKWGLAGIYRVDLRTGALLPHWPRPRVDDDPEEGAAHQRGDWEDDDQFAYDLRVQRWEAHARELRLWKMDVVDLRACQREWNKQMPERQPIPATEIGT